MDKFTPKHYMFIIWGATIVSLKTFPSIITRHGGRDSWISVTISSLIILFFALYIIKIFKDSNSCNIYEIYCTTLGKIPGTILIFLFILNLFFTLVESAGADAHSMHTNMLIETPIWYLLLFFVAPGIYIVSKGKVALVTISIIGITLIMLAGTNLAMLTARYKKLSYLFPIFEHGVNREFIMSILESLGFYGSFSVTLPFISDIRDKNSLSKYTAIALIVVIQMEIISISGVIMTFGVDRVNVMQYPKLLQTQLVSYFRFLESGELYVMLQILGGWILKYAITFYAITRILQSVGIKGKYIIYVISALVYIVAFWSCSNMFRFYNLLYVYTYICLLNYIIIPFIVFTIYKFKTSKSTEECT